MVRPLRKRARTSPFFLLSYEAHHAHAALIYLKRPASGNFLNFPPSACTRSKSYSVYAISPARVIVSVLLLALIDDPG